MTLSRTTDHGPPTEHPETGYTVCESCHERYRWSSETGEYDREPYGPCSGLKRGSLERTKGVAPVNRERRKRRRVDGDTGVKHTYGSYHRWIQTRPCWIRHHPDHDCDGGGSGHHVRHVGNGGKDPANEVPLCEPAHQELHRIGKGTWEGRYDVSLQRARWTLWDRFRQAHPERAEKLAGYTPARTADAGG